MAMVNFKELSEQFGFRIYLFTKVYDFHKRLNFNTVCIRDYHISKLVTMDIHLVLFFNLYKYALSFYLRYGYLACKTKRYPQTILKPNA